MSNYNFIDHRIGLVVGHTPKKITIHTQSLALDKPKDTYEATNVDWNRLIKIDSNMVQDIIDNQ